MFEHHMGENVFVSGLIAGRHFYFSERVVQLRAN